MIKIKTPKTLDSILNQIETTINRLTELANRNEHESSRIDEEIRLKKIYVEQLDTEADKACEIARNLRELIGKD